MEVQIVVTDNADSPADTEGFGSFDNKAPRLSAFDGNADECESSK